MVRSQLSVPTASIGAVRLVAPFRTTSPSLVAMLALAPTYERTDSLFVALRIDTLISAAI